MEKMENSLACVAVKSAVDISKLAFNDFLSLYGPILKKAFGDDEQEIKALLNEAKEIYSMLKENSNIVNAINIDKSLEYVRRIDKANIGNQWYIVRGLKNGKVEFYSFTNILCKMHPSQYKCTIHRNSANLYNSIICFYLFLQSPILAKNQ